MSDAGKNDDYLGLSFQDGFSAIPIAGRLREYSTEDFHFHRYTQFIWIQNGITLLVREKSRQPLYGSMCALIPAGQRHRSVVIGEPVRYLSLNIRPCLFPADRIEVFYLSDLSVELYKRMGEFCGTDLCCGIGEECLGLFLHLAREDIRGRAFTMGIPNAKTDFGKRAIEYIESHFSEPCLVREIASALCYSERHFARLFKQDLGISVHEYLRIYRMFRASIMLGDQKSTVTGTAYSCGYESLSSFYADFRRCYGVRPAQFRSILRA